MTEKKYEDMDKIEKEIYDAARKYDEEHGESETIPYDEPDLERIVDIYNQMSSNYNKIKEEEESAGINSIEDFIDHQRSMWKK